MSRDELLRRVWHVDPRNLETRTVDMAVARLREKLGEPAQAPRVLLTTPPAEPRPTSNCRSDWM